MQPQKKSLRDGIKDKKLIQRLKNERQQTKVRADDRRKMEFVLPEDEGFLEADENEKTHQFRQDEIVANVDITAARKKFTLDLHQYGPYSLDYTRNGRYFLLGGNKGHIFMADYIDFKPQCEINVNQSIRDGNAGVLKYMDTSTGQQISLHKTHLGPCMVMEQNPHNAVILVGHTNGVVSMWSPNCAHEPLVKMLTHGGPVRAVSCDLSGHYMATSGLDGGKVKIWDIRQLKMLHNIPGNYEVPISSLQLSQRGILAVGSGDVVNIYKDCLSQAPGKEPYMTYKLTPQQSQVSSQHNRQRGSSFKGSLATKSGADGGTTSYGSVHQLKFVPFDDALGIGHGAGFSSIIVPGSGLANYDSLEADPFETKKRRKEGEVKQLLDKLPASMITLNPQDVGTVGKGIIEHEKDMREINIQLKQLGKKEGSKDKQLEKGGKQRRLSAAQKRMKRMQKNIITKEKIDLEHKIALDRQVKERQKTIDRMRKEKEKPFDPLARFSMKTDD
ncbi:MAG: putative U3 small nucleolar RNA-associated protein 7 [Streblomastix strix]|uniref:Putative U3 small nucleolar RNA-associated protein 7 n=1 Tax=Streblomastix strix TaxID=222440 RepID=A0A5J4W670_9EUKA|nr:MAG: putative U3 small nucleolar RNA-associated protein 7 [Streblomastix strix]